MLNNTTHAVDRLIIESAIIGGHLMKGKLGTFRISTIEYCMIDEKDPTNPFIRARVVAWFREESDPMEERLIQFDSTEINSPIHFTCMTHTHTIERVEVAKDGYGWLYVVNENKVQEGYVGTESISSLIVTDFLKCIRNTAEMMDIH